MSEKNRLRVVRAEQRITQLALAAAAQIHPSRVWKIENGYVVANESERKAIASALAVSERDVWPVSEQHETPTGMKKATCSHRSVDGN